MSDELEDDTPQPTRDYLCEVCEKVETLTEKQAYLFGWDYPPFIGTWGVISPRTCPDCTINETAYWALLLDRNPNNLSEKHKATVGRIILETLND